MDYTHTVVITMGRMIGSHVMSQYRWQLFKLAVDLDLELAGVVVIQHPQMGAMRAHDQVGEWEGVPEPACTFVGLIEGYGRIAILRRALAQTAAEFEQQCVGCIVVVGTDHLVFA